jgi:RHH-type proline utilization regulon transcriptional repressor/proline dehydrogenase/delta 1-pyrroline-5-carboxylate dehydrogenase
VQSSIADGIVEMLKGALQQLHVGQPANLATDVGPVIDDEAHTGISRHVERLKRDAKLIAEAPVTETMPRQIRPVAFELERIAHLGEEIFGPVASVLRWRDEEDVMARVNALQYGLTASIWTHDLDRAHRLASRVEAGYVWINGASTHHVGVPFGGYKQSGIGREESIEELLACTQIKNVNVTLKRMLSAR